MILDDEDVLIEKSQKNNLNILTSLLYKMYCDNEVIQYSSIYQFLNRILKDYNYNFCLGSININKKNLEYAGHISYGFQYLQDSRVILNISIYCKEIDIFNIFSIDRNEYVYNKSAEYYIYKTTYVFNEKKKTS